MFCDNTPNCPIDEDSFLGGSSYYYYDESPEACAINHVNLALFFILSIPFLIIPGLIYIIGFYKVPKLR